MYDRVVFLRLENREENVNVEARPSTHIVRTQNFVRKKRRARYLDQFQPTHKSFTSHEITSRESTIFKSLPKQNIYPIQCPL